MLRFVGVGLGGYELSSIYVCILLVCALALSLSWKRDHFSEWDHTIDKSVHGVCVEVIVTLTMVSQDDCTYGEGCSSIDIDADVDADIDLWCRHQRQ